MLRYDDPVSLIWLATAQRLGMKVERSDGAYAAWDGATLTIGSPETLDAGDSVAQLIFHEICHALVEGPDAFGEIDWGLDNRGDGDEVREHASLRLQAALATRHGLRRFFAPTTEFRAYYDALPERPLAVGEDPAIALARDAWPRGREGAWAAPLEEALESTGVIARLVRGLAPEESVWHKPG